MSELNGLVKRIRKIMRKDNGVDGDAQRISTLVWMLFLKVYDEFEEAFYRLLTTEEKTIINTLIKTYNATLVLKALKVAVNDKLPSLLYIKDILNYWNKFNNSDIVPNLKLNKCEYFLKTVAN